jgi:hypothetical protein
MIPTILHVNKPSKKKMLGYENLYKEIIINFFLQSVEVTYLLEKFYQLLRVKCGDSKVSTTSNR